MNRLGELKKKKGGATDDDDDNDSKDVELGGAGAGELTDQVKLYDPIKEISKTIRLSARRVRDSSDKLAKTPNEADRKVIMSQVNAIFTETNGNGAECKRRLDNIKTENEKFSKDNSGSATAAARVNLHRKHAQDFVDAMKDFTEASDSFKKGLQDTTRRQLKNVGLKEEEVEKVVESGQAAQVLQNALISDDIEEIVEDIQSRHDEILKLERSVLEVQSLFLDLANLVSVQQDHIDTIETHISNAARHTDTGAKQLTDAEGYAKKARKRQCMIVAIVLIVLLVILIPTIIKVMGSS